MMHRAIVLYLCVWLIQKRKDLRLEIPSFSKEFAADADYDSGGARWRGRDGESRGLSGVGS